MILNRVFGKSDYIEVADYFKAAVVGGQWSVVSSQWSVSSGRWLVVSGRWLVAGGQWLYSLASTQILKRAAACGAGDRIKPRVKRLAEPWGAEQIRGRACETGDRRWMVSLHLLV
jgi:hypothetical protein